jgi:hypothetical protein
MDAVWRCPINLSGKFQSHLFSTPFPQTLGATNRQGASRSEILPFLRASAFMTPRLTIRANENLTHADTLKPTMEEN